MELCIKLICTDRYGVNETVVWDINDDISWTYLATGEWLSNNQIDRKENEIKEAVRLATTLNTKHVLAFDSNNGHTVIVKPTEVSDDILSICINESYEEAQEAEQEWWSNIGSKYFQKNAIHENL